MAQIKAYNLYFKYMHSQRLEANTNYILQYINNHHKTQQNKQKSTWTKGKIDNQVKKQNRYHYAVDYNSYFA